MRDTLSDTLANAGMEALGILFALQDAGLIPEKAQSNVTDLRARFEAIKAMHAAAKPC